MKIPVEPPDRPALIALLNSQGEGREALYRRADCLRRDIMGDIVFIRGIIEFSNICQNDCLYCGIRASNHKVSRYVLSAEEIMAIARRMPDAGQTTIVLQSGESPAFGDRELGDLIRRIKQELGLAVTVSAGNRTRDVYRYWRNCGMDRYLIRFETSDRSLFAKLHPDCSFDERIACLHILRELDVQTGGGFMIGLPGETLETLADNILLCRELELDMIGIGPFIPHPDTPLRDAVNTYAQDPEMFFKALSALRLCNPRAHIPATTAYDAVFPGTGRDLALQRGANVFMPNNTPAEYRHHYLLYPGKPCVTEDAEACTACVLNRIHRLGRTIGTGPGHALRLK